MLRPAVVPPPGDLEIGEVAGVAPPTPLEPHSRVHLAERAVAVAAQQEGANRVHRLRQHVALAAARPKNLGLFNKQTV
eukprot:5288572-Pyramimonas_sp.AAC.1